jgi:type IV fimbrial biogenesis protein FimT
LVIGDHGNLLDNEERLLLMSRPAQSGISLVEILIAIAIVAIVFALGLPTYTLWIQNTQIRTASEAVLNGLQAARNEAIRRNVAVQFQLMTGVDSQWAVNLSSTPDLNPPLIGRPAGEGSPNVTITRVPADADTVTFSALGRVTSNADGSSSLTQVNLDNPTIAVVADRRSLQIVIPTGGAIRLCDPQVAAGDPRACPAP